MRVIAVFFARDEGCHRRRTVFGQSPSVISAHTPGAHGASRATDLCVPLVADSTSNFAESAHCLKKVRELPPEKPRGRCCPVRGTTVEVMQYRPHLVAAP